MSSQKYTREAIQQAITDLLLMGLIVPTGEFRNGQPVYRAANLDGDSAEIRLPPTSTRH
jgi:hypothetical protein